MKLLGALRTRGSLSYTAHLKDNCQASLRVAFRSPNVFELYYNDGGNFFQSQIRSVTRKDKDLRDSIGTVRTQADPDDSQPGFHYKIEDLISQQIDPNDDLLVFIKRREIFRPTVRPGSGGKWDSGLSGRD